MDGHFDSTFRTEAKEEGNTDDSEDDEEVEVEVIVDQEVQLENLMKLQDCIGGFSETIKKRIGKGMSYTTPYNLVVL